MSVPLEDFPLEVQGLLEDRAAKYRALAERGAVAQRLEADLAAVEATASSRRGEVRVTLSHAGLLKDVRFSPAAMSMAPTALAWMTLATIREAMARLQAQVEAAADAAGGGAVADTAVAQYRRNLSQPMSQLPSDDLEKPSLG